MKILAVSDVQSKYFYEYYTRGKLDGYDLILSCGDLHPEYLEFLVTMAHCPLLYVHGNHDETFRHEPEGCTCIDGTVYEYRGLRIAGLGGSYRYRDGLYMYTERQMKRRIFRMGPKLRRRGGIDILLTHAPLHGHNDLEDLPHRGFACFERILERYEPAFFVHGHVHLNYGTKIPRRSSRGKTEILNAYEYCVFEIPDRE